MSIASCHSCASTRMKWFFSRASRNGTPLPIQHGAPLRLRVETQVGFKMAKWIHQIEFVEDYAGIGMGTGGWREDRVYYDKDVEI